MSDTRPLRTVSASDVAAETQRNIELLRTDPTPVLSALRLVSSGTRMMPEVLDGMFLVTALGDEIADHNKEGFQVIASQLRMFAEMLDLAMERAEKENLKR